MPTSPPCGKLERDGDNQPTGVIAARAMRWEKSSTSCRSRRSTQQVDSSKKFFHEMNSLGITGISRRRRRQHVSGQLPGRVQAVARQAADGARRLSSVRAEARQRSQADLQNLTQLLPPGFGDSGCCISTVPAKS